MASGVKYMMLIIYKKFALMIIICAGAKRHLLLTVGSLTVWGQEEIKQYYLKRF